MITIENLKHFVAVIDNQGVVRASEKIFISASSITRSIQNIELELGKSVFDRIGRKIQINQEGQKFYEKSREFLSHYDHLLTESSVTPKLQGHYKIGASHFLSEHMLADLTLRFSQKHYNASLEAYSYDSSVLMKKIHNGEIDLGISFSPKITENLESETLQTGQLLLCGGKKHALSNSKFSEVKKKISDFPAIIHRPTDSIERCDNHPMFKKFNIQPTIQMYWDSDYFALKVLSGNDHWSMLPDIVIDSCAGVKSFEHPSNWDAPYEIGLVWNKRKAIDELKNSVLSLVN